MEGILPPGPQNYGPEARRSIEEERSPPPGDAQYDPASYRRPPRILSLMVSRGSFHKSIRASGGSKPRDASATNPPVDLTPATMPMTAAKSTHTTAIARFICLNPIIPTLQ